MKYQKAMWEEFLDFQPWVRHTVVIVGFFVCLYSGSFFWFSVWFGCFVMDLLGTLMKAAE